MCSGFIVMLPVCAIYVRTAAISVTQAVCDGSARWVQQNDPNVSGCNYTSI